MENLYTSLAKISKVRLFFLFWAIAEFFSIVSVVIVVFLGDFLVPASHENEEFYLNNDAFFNNPLFVIFLGLVVIAPIVETTIFQVILLNLTKRLTLVVIKSDSWLPAFVITSILFAYSHALVSNSFSDISNVLFRIPGGVLLTLLAIVERERKQGSAFIPVACLHGLHNLVTFFTLLVLETMLALDS